MTVLADSGPGLSARAPALVSAVAGALTLAVLTVGSHRLSPAPSFLPAILSVVACFDVLSIYLLIGDYRDNGDPRILAMSAAYLWSLVLMAGYALAFPGVFSARGPLARTPSLAPWLYVGWHAGFPALLGAAWAPWPAWAGRQTPANRRVFVARTAAVVAGSISAAAVTGLVVAAHHLPVLIHGRDTSRMGHLTAPVTLPVVALALAASWFGTRRHSGPERWTSVAILACLCDLLLTYSAGYRYSVGWYVGRTMTVTGSAVVLFAMLVGFRRLKRRAEFNAAYDSLTGLANRRSTLDSLGVLFDSARRTSADLGVVLLDLDRFKQVNDQHGHAAGDELLGAVGRVLADAVRGGDIVGRVGGEEFLAVLPGTDARGAALVAERMRLAIGDLDIAAAGGRSTASVGVAVLDVLDSGTADLVRRADEALYRAKAGGRDRVVAAAKPVVAQAGTSTREVAVRARDVAI